ncbi:hypothetical protein BB776_04745 [Planococcus salinarum]|uniref:GGDEF domain-containing protein n=1 Tax=Planococcus salinarum TaxID=622695 RepID=A0ABX3CRU9_9BACL|nr:hypothetical protein BB776_04745 [Planococcus salinarum]
MIPLKRAAWPYFFQNIDQQKRLEGKLTDFAYSDDLTGLPNRRKMTEIAVSLKQQGKKFSFFYINLDNLKFINASIITARVTKWSSVLPKGCRHWRTAAAILPSRRGRVYRGPRIGTG